VDVALLLARLLLAAVFAVSGLTKLADRAGTRQAVRDFGVPAALATPFAIFLPLAELVVAVALIPQSSAWWAGVGALALMLLFIVGIAVNMARGKSHDCHCFGQLYSEPIGWSTLIRNGVLAAIAGGIVGFGYDDPGLSAVAWLEDLSGAETALLVGGVILALVVLVEGWLLLNLLRQNGRLLERLEALEVVLTPGAEGAEGGAPRQPAPMPERGLPVGSPAPAFSLTGMFGETLTLDALRAAGKPVMLLFSDPNCGPCNALMPEIGRWQREYSGQLTVAVVSRGAAEANRGKAAEHMVSNMLLQQDREVAEAFRSVGTPSAVLVQPDGTIGSPLAEGAQAIQALVARVTGSQAATQRLPMAPAQPARPNGSAAAARPSHANGPAAQQARPNGPTARPVAQQAQPSMVGQVAPELQLPDLSGHTVDLAALRGQKTMLLFWNPGCGFCRRMLDDLKVWEANRPADAPNLLIVSTGTVEANAAQGIQSTIVLDQNFATGRKFGARGTPSAVLIDADGTIATPVAVGGPAVLSMVGAEPKPATA
jgi:thiol-disulfide isomerase/thioredoxin